MITMRNLGKSIPNPKNKKDQKDKKDSKDSGVYISM
jgi:hypothetical protein